MKKVIFPILAIAFISLAIAVVYPDIDEYANTSYQDCVNGSRGQCLTSLHDFKAYVKEKCKDNNQSACEYGITKFWRTTRDIGKARGYFDSALLSATTLTLWGYYYNENTTNYTINAFSDAVRDPQYIRLIECIDGNCTETYYEFKDLTINYELYENGTIKSLWINVTIVDESGEATYIIGKEGSGGGTGPAIKVVSGGSEENYTTLDMNLESASDNWIKVQK